MLTQDLVRFLQTFLLLNLYKEIGRYFQVSAAYVLTVADLKNTGVVVNRDAAVAPVLMYQTFMSLVFRLEVANYDDPRVALVMCIFQGLLELVRRLTAAERDAWIRRTAFWPCRSASRTRHAITVVVVAAAPESEGQTPNILAKHMSERVATAEERSAIVRQFQARMILIDMWAEFAGIYIGFVVLLLGQSNALYFPFRPFRKYPELFHGGNYYAELAFGTVVQIAIEIIVDTVCVVFETRRGLQLLTVWREFPKAAFTPIILFALIYATYVGQARSILGDSLDPCNHRDFCWCVGSGLLPGGVREGYCLLLYPNSSGRPTN